MADFWVGQADTGLVSPSARHHETRDVLLKRMGSPSTTATSPAPTLITV